MLTITDLPEEVMVLLFSYLPFKDRLNARLVNKSWLDLLDSSTLSKNHVFVVKQETDLNQHKLLRRNINLRIENIAYPLEHQEFWEQHGPNVRSIEIFEVDLRSSQLYAIINYCPNVQVLSLRTRQPPFLWLLPESTEHSDSTPVADMDMDKFCGNLRNLLSLNLEFPKTVKGADLYAFTKHACHLRYLKIGCYLELNDLAVEAIASKPLQKLTISAERVITKANVDFVLRLGPQLTKLCLAVFPGQLDEWLPVLADKFPLLEELGITFERQGLNDPSLLLSLKNLKFLSFKGSKVGKNVLSVIMELPNLRGLDVSGCKLLVSSGICKALGSNLNPMLVDLRLSNIWAVNDTVLACILPQLPNLKNLYLQRCTSITSIGLSHIVTNCKILECLSLKSCLKVVEWSSINGLTELRYLNVENCSMPVELFEDGGLQLPELTNIRLHGTSWLTVAGYKSLLTHCPSLRRVYCQIKEEDRAQLQVVGEQMGKPLCLTTRLKLEQPFFDFFGHFV